MRQNRATCIWLFLLIICFAFQSNSLLAQENQEKESGYSLPANLTPVWKWKNGFTAYQAKQFIKTYNAKSFVIGDDIGTYAYLNLCEILKGQT